MTQRPYHHYLFFDIDHRLYALPKEEQGALKQEFSDLAKDSDTLAITPYVMLGFKPEMVFMLWCRSQDIDRVANFLRDVHHQRIGQYFMLRQTLFGIIRPSQYSRKSGSQEQAIQENERLPYLLIYPFTKTTEWYQLSLDQRRELMREHIKTGIQHADIRQCLLYSYGVDDNEFIVSYETPSLEAFQDLIIAMRSIEVRRYTLNDLPIYTCLYKPMEELVAWL